MDNISDRPRLSINEKAGVKGVVAENGRMILTTDPFASAAEAAGNHGEAGRCS